jgi:hypothetical protein
MIAFRLTKRARKFNKIGDQVLGFQIKYGFAARMNAFIKKCYGSEV